MTGYDPRKIAGPADGLITDQTGKPVGFFWENPKTKGMTEEQRKAYWAEYDRGKTT